MQTYTNPESGDQYELGEYGLIIKNHIGEFVVSEVSGTLAINPIEGPYDASQFGPYMDVAFQQGTAVVIGTAILEDSRPGFDQPVYGYGIPAEG